MTQDTQRRLVYENISYTKEQNEKLLDAIQVAESSVEFGKTQIAGLEEQLAEYIKAKAIIHKTRVTYDTSYMPIVQLDGFECYSEDEFIQAHKVALAKLEALSAEGVLLKKKLSNRVLWKYIVWGAILVGLVGNILLLWR